MDQTLPSKDATATEEAVEVPLVIVLVAEDNRVNQLVAQAMLTRLGCCVRLASDGGAAVEATTDDVDIVFMDCSMPDVDGFEATARLRARGGRHVPVVALTAHAGAADREMCFAAGMDDFVSKPFGPAELARALERWVPRYQGGVRDLAAGTPVLDEEVLDTLRTLGGPDDPGFLGDIVGAFEDAVAAGLASLEAAVAASDWTGVRTLSHKLASACSSVGASRLFQLCRRMEKEEALAARAASGLRIVRAEAGVASIALRKALLGEQ